MGSFKSASSFKSEGSFKEFLKKEKIVVKEAPLKKKKVMVNALELEMRETEEKTRTQLQDFVMSVSKKEDLQIQPRKSNNPFKKMDTLKPFPDQRFRQQKTLRDK